MRKDTPVLNDAVTEIAARRLAHNDAAVAYALAGAGLMRGMQIKVDRKLASKLTINTFYAIINR